jgi:murein DD-endopeptidase MepM/ murein hydrolase activator NlpD|tara:strand:- start:43216 stop:44067 length:852 start_codon:yes stop_codon:yes gene_type:complete
MKHKIIKWFKFKLQIIFRNERDFKEILLLNFSNFNLIIYTILLIFIIFSFSFFLSTTILKQWFDPRYVEQKANQELIDLSNSIDSLANTVKIKDQFIDNVMLILSGKENSKIELETESSFILENNIKSNYSAVDSFFRNEFEKDINLLKGNNISSYNENIFLNLISPVSSGVILGKYNPSKGHFGVDFVCKKEEPIKAIFDGVVILSSWTKDSGYVISIVHPNNIISIYKHNSKVFVESGQLVKTGDIISIIGDTGELSSGPHLHFELWLDGKSINPSEFISL